MASAEDVQGTWLAETDGESVTLVVAGETAAIAGEHVCTGSATDTGQVTLSLTCVDRDTDRTMGAVGSGDGKTMTVVWESGIKDSFEKTAEAEVPDGLDLPALQ